MDLNDLRQGKVRLDVADYAADLSGKDFENIFLEATQSLSHSFLNGVSFHSSVFLGGPIDQTELAETEILDCVFIDTDFNGSSFIGAKVANSKFVNCNFTDGEWRQSQFTDVLFESCNFNYTTINLCVFDNCTFTGEGSKRIDNRSVNYNVFIRNRFEFAVKDDVVRASNFGLRSEDSGKALAGADKRTSLEEYCVKSSFGNASVAELIDAIQNEFIRSHQARLRLLRLEFVSNIITGLTRTSKISATSLAYLEMLFATIARSARNENELMSAMSSLINIRNLLIGASEFIPLQHSEYAGDLCRGLNIRYERTFTRKDAKDLSGILGYFARGDVNAFKLRKFTTGSSIIDLITNQALSVGAALLAINYTLQQANVTFKRVRILRRNASKLFDAISGKGELNKARKKSRAIRALALQRSGAVTKEISALKKIVQTYGYKVVLLDDRAKVTIYFDSRK
jgi:Pentapeptide repeats (9 copies)